MSFVEKLYATLPALAIGVAAKTRGGRALCSLLPIKLINIVRHRRLNIGTYFHGAADRFGLPA